MWHGNPILSNIFHLFHDIQNDKCTISWVLVWLLGAFQTVTLAFLIWSSESWRFSLTHCTKRCTVLCLNKGIKHDNQPDFSCINIVPHC